MMVDEDRREIDTIGQWYRRISDITYCYYKDGEYGCFTIPMSEYLGYTPLQRRALDLPPIPSLFETASWGRRRGGGIVLPPTPLPVTNPPQTLATPA